MVQLWPAARVVPPVVFAPAGRSHMESVAVSNRTIRTRGSAREESVQCDREQ